MEFHQSQGGKVRPAIIILDTGDDDVIVAPVTSRPQFSEFDFAIRDWRTSGLSVASFVRVHKLTVVPKSEIQRHLGRLGEIDSSELLRVLTRFHA